MKPSPSTPAKNYKIGTKKKGNDGNYWIVSKNYRWYKQSKRTVDTFDIFKAYQMPKLKPSKYNLHIWTANIDRLRFNYFNNVIVPRIRKLGIKAMIIPIGLSKSGHYFIDAAHEIAKQLYRFTPTDKPYIYIVLRITSDNLLESDETYILHDNLAPCKAKLAELLRANCTTYSWDGTQKSAIRIVF